MMALVIHIHSNTRVRRHLGFVELKGDCDDTDPLVNNLDLDEDGLSTCNGDCDDSDSDLKRRKDLQRFR